MVSSIKPMMMKRVFSSTCMLMLASAVFLQPAKSGRINPRRTPILALEQDVLAAQRTWRRRLPELPEVTSGPPQVDPKSNSAAAESTAKPKAEQPNVMAEYAPIDVEVEPTQFDIMSEELLEIFEKTPTDEEEREKEFSKDNVLLYEDILEVKRKLSDLGMSTAHSAAWRGIKVTAAWRDKIKMMVILKRAEKEWIPSQEEIDARFGRLSKTKEELYLKLLSPFEVRQHLLRVGAPQEFFESENFDKMVTIHHAFWGKRWKPNETEIAQRCLSPDKIELFQKAEIEVHFKDDIIPQNNRVTLVKKGEWVKVMVALRSLGKEWKLSRKEIEEGELSVEKRMTWWYEKLLNGENLKVQKYLQSDKSKQAKQFVRDNYVAITTLERVGLKLWEPTKEEYRSGHLSSEKNDLLEEIGQITTYISSHNPELWLKGWTLFNVGKILAMKKANYPEFLPTPEELKKPGRSNWGLPARIYYGYKRIERVWKHVQQKAPWMLTGDAEKYRDLILLKKTQVMYKNLRWYLTKYEITNKKFAGVKVRGLAKIKSGYAPY